MSGMFNGASAFNQPLPLSFVTSSVTDMSYMFNGASAFDQSLNFDTSKVTTMSAMFSGASAFDQSLNLWEVGQVTDMSRMFSGTRSFNQDLNSWKVSHRDMSGQVKSQVTDMSYMFYQSSFNQDLNSWFPSFFYSSSLNMGRMFAYTPICPYSCDCNLNKPDWWKECSG